MRPFDHPRVVAAAAFGIAGASLPTLWYAPLFIPAAHLKEWLLFIGTPAASAAIAGAVGGASLLDPARTRSETRAALRGALVALAALVAFAPLFSTFYAVTAPSREHVNIIGLSALLLIGGMLAAGPWVVPIGMVVGWFLYRRGVARQRRFTSGQSEP